jgi:endonuclease-3
MSQSACDNNNDGIPSSSPKKKRKAPATTPATPSRSTTRRNVKLAISVTPEATISSSSIPTKKTPSTETKKKKVKRKSNKPPLFRSPPAGWHEIYSLVEELRQDRSAPVDSYGSEALPDKSADPKTYRFQILVALILSSQTKDSVVGYTMRSLQQHGLTVDNIVATSPEDFNALIRKVSFHNNKTKYIKQAVEILRDQYDGDIPPSADALMDLPGVGPRMAFIVEKVAWNIISGIRTDTHMHRMFNELKWVQSNNAEQTRVQVQSWLPQEYWKSVNLLWAGMGQEVQLCKPKLLRKALDCSRPKEALKLVKQLGLDYIKEGKKLGWTEDIQAVLTNSDTIQLTRGGRQPSPWWDSRLHSMNQTVEEFVLRYRGSPIGVFTTVEKKNKWSEEV